MLRTSPGDRPRAVVRLVGAGFVGLLFVASGSRGPASSPELISNAVVLRAQERPPTFTDDVAPLVFRRCIVCHHDGGAGPFPLVTFSSVKQHASQIVDVTKRRFMPPWKPDPAGSLEFVGSPRLRDGEIELIARWARAGAPEGASSAPPPVPAFAPGWRLGSPDLVVSPAEAYTLQADGTDVFRIFVIPLGTSALRYVRGLEFHPGNARVVHHANIRI